jgi:hypothetical protein
MDGVLADDEVMLSETLGVRRDAGDILVAWPLSASRTHVGMCVEAADDFLPVIGSIRAGRPTGAALSFLPGSYACRGDRSSRRIVARVRSSGLILW